MFNNLAKTTFSTGPDDQLLVTDVYGGITTSDVINTAADSSDSESPAAKPQMTSMCGCCGKNNALPTVVPPSVTKPKDPFASVAKEVSMAPSGVGDLAKALPGIPSVGSSNSFTSMLNSAVSGFGNVLKALPVNQLNSMYNAFKGVTTGNNPMAAVGSLLNMATGNSSSFNFPSSQLSQMKNLMSMANTFQNSASAGFNSSGGLSSLMSITDRNSTTGILAGIMGQAGSLNVSGLISSLLPGLPKTMVDRAISAALPGVVNSGSLGVFNELAKNSTPGLIKNQYPNAIGDFSKSYSPNLAPTNTTTQYDIYKSAIDTCNAVDPNWNIATRGNVNENSPFYDMSSILGGNADMMNMLKTGAMLDKLKNPGVVNGQADALGLSGSLLPAEVNPSNISNYFPTGYSTTNTSGDETVSYSQPDPATITITDIDNSTIKRGTDAQGFSYTQQVVKPYRDGPVDLTGSTSSVIGGNGTSTDVSSNYGNVDTSAVDVGTSQRFHDPNYHDPAANAVDAVTGKSNTSSWYEPSKSSNTNGSTNPAKPLYTGPVLYGDEPEFDGADEEAKAAKPVDPATTTFVYH